MPVEPAWSTRISGCLSSGKELCPSPRLGRGTPAAAFLPQLVQRPPTEGPGLVSPFSKAWTPGVQGRAGRRFLGTRLTCSTVGVCVPGFLVKHQGALGSDHPHERRDFAGRRETLDTFSTASLLLCWLPSDCFRVLKYKINVETTKWLCFKQK